MTDSIIIALISLIGSMFSAIVGASATMYASGKKGNTNCAVVVLVAALTGIIGLVLGALFGTFLVGMNEFVPPPSGATNVPTPLPTSANPTPTDLQQPPSQQRQVITTETFTVLANSPWQDTAILVQPGDFLKIDYISGQWTGESGAGVYHGPDAGTNPNVFDCMPIPGEGPSLIGTIGSGAPFKVGLQYLGEATGTGNLYLRINDCDEWLTDNDGNIVVKVQVSR